MNKSVLIILIVIVIFSGMIGWKLIKPNSGPVVQSHRGYEIEVTSNINNIKPQKSVVFTYKIRNDKGEILKDYEVAHEKIMHFIVVRKDLAYFQHLHPDFNKATGEFSVDVTYPDHGPYRIFPDFTPGDENPQKLPVTVSHDVEVGNSSKYYAQSVVPDSEQTKTYGNYKVTMAIPSDTKKQEEVTYTLNITKNGKPVTNLENYLGALGHSVILKEESLDFIHTHAFDATDDNAMQEHTKQQETASNGPKISFATTFPESGVYKIFTQFQHEGEVQTVDYIVKVN